jgi:hypothetical protein
MRKLIEVKESHIKNGKPRSYSSCPIALSLKEYGYKAVGVDDDCAEVDGYSVELPTRATRFIHKFDNNRPVKAFKFWLNDLITEAQ